MPWRWVPRGRCNRKLRDGNHSVNQTVQKRIWIAVRGAKYENYWAAVTKSGSLAPFTSDQRSWLRLQARLYMPKKPDTLRSSSRRSIHSCQPPCQLASKFQQRSKLFYIKFIYVSHQITWPKTCRHPNSENNNNINFSHRLRTWFVCSTRP